MARDTFLRRYTNLPSLVGMLTHGELTLLEPLTWDDKNDAYFLEQYRLKSNLKSVLALCLSRARETYHHWHVFAPGPAGVCVWFREDQLKDAVSKIGGLRIQPVKYLRVGDLRKNGIPVTELPFVKRYPFKPENEVRLLWESSNQAKTSLAVPFESSAIERITLSPWLHPSLADPVKQLVKTLPQCRKYKVLRSTLTGNTEWKRIGRAAT